MYKGTILSGMTFDYCEAGGIDALNGFITSEKIRELTFKQQSALFNPDNIKKIINSELTIDDVITEKVYEHSAHEAQSIIATTGETENQSFSLNKSETGCILPDRNEEEESLALPEESNAAFSSSAATSHLFSASSSGSSTEGNYSVEASNPVGEGSAAGNKNLRRRKR
jgi:hypothetical protein